MFKQIPNTKYEINTEGQVRRIYKTTISYIKAYIENSGYYRVPLTENGKTKKFSIHRLLALTFLPNPNNFPIIDHIDRNRTNNNLDNLRWCDYSTNNRNKDLKKFSLYIENSKVNNKYEYKYYCVAWRDENGKRKKKRFKTEIEQLEFIKSPQEA